jgi:DNA polymerase type B, organellar and viral
MKNNTKYFKSLNHYTPSNMYYLHFSVNNFTQENFITEIVNNFKLNCTYSLLIKVSSDENTIFKQVGPQIGLRIKDKHDIEFYNNLFSSIELRINGLIENYVYMTGISYIEILYYPLTIKKELQLNNINSIHIPKQLTNISHVKTKFNNNLLPLTTDTYYYGELLINEDREIAKTLIINSNFNIKDFNINLDDKIYLYTNKIRSTYLVYKIIEPNIVNILIFDSKTGIFIEKIRDVSTLTPKDFLKVFNRTINSTTLTIVNEKVTNISIEHNLDRIKPKISKALDRNTNLGAFDLETFIDSDGIAKVYALGFKTNIDEESQIFYIKSAEDNPNYLIKECIDAMLITKYNNFTFYCHNLGKYDSIFIHGILSDINKELGQEYYMMKSLFRDNSLLKLEIKLRKSYNNFVKITLVDSLNLLNMSLDKLSKEFNVGEKGIFPYTFVNRNTLFYIGQTPHIDYYNHIQPDEYEKLTKSIWNLKKETIKYLNNDIVSLLNIMNEFSWVLYRDYNTELTEGLTITRIALNIFLKTFYNYKEKAMPLILKIFLFNFIKEGYYGGVTEVYKPYGRDLIYIDVNSLYPYMALKDYPGTKATYLEAVDGELELDNLFGFFYAQVKTNNQYLGLLPIHKNQLILPNGSFEGIWSSEELKFAKKNGYTIKVLKGYNFNKISNLFDNYVLHLFEIKKNSTNYIKIVAKSLLNNLLGRFALSIVKPVTSIVNEKKKDWLSITRKIHSFKLLKNNQYLITFNPLISRDICNMYGLDLLKVLDKESKETIENSLDIFKDVSITTTAMNTSYARIFMNEIKLEILKNGGDIYYTDTDSIILNKTYMNKNWIGKNIGQFKIEYDIEEAYFISNKTYCLILKNGETIIKAKGVTNNKLNVNDFKNMYFNNKNIETIKTHTTIKYDKASVIIQKKDITINSNAYTKREKVFNNKGIWIDTKPLTIS